MIQKSSRLFRKKKQNYFCPRNTANQRNPSAYVLESLLQISSKKRTKNYQRFSYQPYLLQTPWFMEAWDISLAYLITLPYNVPGKWYIFARKTKETTYIWKKYFVITLSFYVHFYFCIYYSYNIHVYIVIMQYYHTGRWIHGLSHISIISFFV